VLLYLLRGKQTLGPRMGSLQCFTLLLHFLAAGGLTRHGPLALPPLDDEPLEAAAAAAGGGGGHKEPLNAWGYPAGLPLGAVELLSFGQHFEVTLVDPATRLNWLSSVSASGAAEVAREAAASVAWLQVQHDQQT
jgi:hypothetical protein